jgi:hypothetical protein
MTLYEAKGLEFNDVLLYDFFADSMAALSEWRVVLNGIDDNKRAQLSAPRFDDTRHALLCSEVSLCRMQFRLFVDFIGFSFSSNHYTSGSRVRVPMYGFWTLQRKGSPCA